MASLPDFQATESPESPKTAMTRKTQHLQVIKVVIIVVIAVITAVFIIIDVVQTAKQYSNKKALRQKIKYTIETAEIIHNLQQERGLSSLFLAQKSWNIEEHRSELVESKKRTNKSVNDLTRWKSFSVNGSSSDDRLSFLRVLEKYRLKFENNKPVFVDIDTHLREYTSLITPIISLLTHYTVSENLETFAGDVFAYQLLVKSKEESGLEKALGSIYFLQGKKFSDYNVSWYNEKRIRSQAFLESAFAFSNHVSNLFTSLTKDNSTLINDIKTARSILASGNLNDTSKISARYWFTLMTFYNQLMLKLQIKDANRIRDMIDNSMKTTVQWLVIRSFLLCFALIVVPAIIISLVQVQNAFYQYTVSLYNKVGLEQGRTEFLMRENARHVENLASRWKNYSKDPEPRNDEINAPQFEGNSTKPVNNINDKGLYNNL